MKKVSLIGAISASILIWSLAAIASDEETQLRTEADQMEQLATQSTMQRKVCARMDAVFESWGAKDSSRLITQARDLKMGYGETMIAGALAAELHEKDPVNYPAFDTAYEKVLSLRRAREKTTGWGVIANDLGVKLGPVVKEIKSARPYVSGHAERFTSNYARKGGAQERLQLREKTKKKQQLRDKYRDEKPKRIQAREQIRGRTESGRPSRARRGGHGRGR